MTNAMSSSPSNLPPILPIGTAVVALVEVRGADGRSLHPRGTTGVVVAAPADTEHSYRVRFPGGDETSLKRREMQVLSHYQREEYETRRSDGHGSRDANDLLGTGGGTQGTHDPMAEYDLSRHVIYRCIIGSRAYGLDRDGSDVDRRGVYLPPASMHWSVYGVPEQLDNPESQECYWELEKFIKLALKANPNVLEVLYTPLVELAEPVAERLRAERGIFLSRLVYQTFNGYAMSQFRKIEQDVRSAGQVKWKHAMHLIRLLRSGAAALRTGELPVRVEDGREELLAIRDGQMNWEDVDALRRSLHADFEKAFEASTLPDRPDYERANAILVAARAEMARREGLV